jgi:hypothetical protein
MSEHQRHTAFLKRLVSYGDTPACKNLVERLANAERDERSVRRKMSGLIALTLISLIGLGYLKLFVPDHYVYTWHVLVRIFSVLGLGSVIGLATFAGCWFWCRKLLNSLRDEARSLVQPVLEEKLGAEGLGSHTQHLVKDEHNMVRPAFKESSSDTSIWLKAA